jgi:hypothetical protein
MSSPDARAFRNISKSKEPCGWERHKDRIESTLYFLPGLVNRAIKHFFGGEGETGCNYMETGWSQTWDPFASASCLNSLLG